MSGWVKLMRPVGTPSASAQICTSTVSEPWPLSTAPVLSTTVPSSSRRTIADEDSMPLMCGTQATPMPRRRPPPPSALAARFAAQPEASRTAVRQVVRSDFASSMPATHSRSAWTALAMRRSIGSMPMRSAISSSCCSPAHATCGPPKPRKAPNRSLLV